MNHPHPSSTRIALGQERAPVFDALRGWHDRGVSRLFMPGHKGVDAAVGLDELVTPLGLSCDLPSMEATDSYFKPVSCIAEAHRLAAELFGGEETFYLVNGATSGVQAMLLAALRPNQKLLLSRFAHTSVFSALALVGAVPIYLESAWSDQAGPIPPTVPQVEAALVEDRSIAAVLITHPTYYGLGRDLSHIADVCHSHGAALLVDEAHGAHLGFLPPGTGPASGLKCGADVVVQSVHKTLGSLVGTAQLHRGHGSRVSSESVRRALNLLQSTSSNYLLLASIDLARRAVWRKGRDRFGHAVERAVGLRDRLSRVPGVSVLASGVEDCLVDPLRLTIDVSGLGISGFKAESQVELNANLLGEFADARNLVYVLGPADSDDVYQKLESAITELSSSMGGRDQASSTRVQIASSPRLLLTPRDAAFRKTTTVPLTQAEGRASGEVVMVYPPGIPLLCPGEEVSGALIEQMVQLSRESACVWANDPSLQTLTVI